MAQSRKNSKREKVEDGGFERLDGFLLNAVEDEPDFRDFRYQPALVNLRPTVGPPNERHVLDQGQEGACTGFGLAAVINHLLRGRQENRRVSARMLYEMAKKFDEWEGEDYEGSSCRGAVRGWHSMGVCSDDLAPYVVPDFDWSLDIDQAKDARVTTLGAYFRVAKKLSDYHAALNEVDAIYASAQVHEGWRDSEIVDGVIPYPRQRIGGHAFAIVGYNDRGFWVQNSWGPSWGDDGVALWLYEDWLENVRDAWVMRLGLSTPQIWHLSPNLTDASDTEQGLFSRSPKRAEIVGHFVHIDDGRFDDKGKYWTDLATVQQTAKLVAESDKYDHLLLYAHGGLNSVSASARRVVAMKEVFKANRIYPFHFMYDTGLLEEIKDVVLGHESDVQARAGGLTDFTDRLIEKASRPAGRAIWREMKRGARKPFDDQGAGAQTIGAFLDAFRAPDAKPKKLHVVGHSTGAILLASLLEAMSDREDPPRVQTCLLLAPACTHADFNRVYRQLLKQRGSNEFGIGRMTIYNLEDQVELDDCVTSLYRKSLLYLVSNAFEEEPPERILGLQKFARFLGTVPGRPVFQIEKSDGSAKGSPKTASETHGGFDNDPFTMNDALRSVLRGTPPRPFTADDLVY